MAAGVLEELVTILGFEVDEGGMEEYEELIEKTGDSLKKWALAGWAAVAAGGAIVTMTAQNIDAAFKLSQRQGTNFEDQQRLSHAADLAGASTDSLTGALGELDKMAAKAKFGEVSEAFQFLGTDVTKANGEVKTGTELFLELADKVAALGTAGERADLVDRLGLPADIVLLMEKGSDEIKRMALELDTLGGTATTAAGRQSEILTDNVIKLTAAAKGAWQQLSNNLAPVLIRISDAMIDWVKANQDLIDSGIEGFAEGLTEALRPAMIFLGLLTVAATGAALVFGGLPALITVGVTAGLALLTGMIEWILRNLDEIKERFPTPADFFKKLGKGTLEFLGFGEDGTAPGVPSDSANVFGFGSDIGNTQGILPPPAAPGIGPQSSATLNQTNNFDISAPDAAAAAEAVARRMEDVAREAAATLATPIVA